MHSSVLLYIQKLNMREELNITCIFVVMVRWVVVVKKFTVIVFKFITFIIVIVDFDKFWRI